MIVNVENFNCGIAAINENSAIALGNTKTVDVKMAWLEKFGMQTWMGRILLKKHFLLRKRFLEIALFDIRSQSLAQWKNIHTELSLG